MNVVKVTTSGQITIPKEIRRSFENKLFICEQVEGTIVFKPLEDKFTHFPKKYTIKDLKQAMFKSKNPKEKDLAGKIDQIVYGL